MSSLTKKYTKTITANNISISYNDAGEGQLPIIFLHGFPFDKSMWQDQIEVLKSSHRVIAYDIRSFGASTNDESELSIELCANDLIKFMEALHITKAILCGFSMGGYIALNAVSRFPNFFAGIILCDTQCIADSEEAKAKRYKRIEQIDAEGTNEFTKDFIKNIFYKKSLTNKKDLVESIESNIQSNSSHVIIGGLKALALRSDTCFSLASIEVPTLIICGREDVITPILQSERMHNTIKNSSFKIIDEAGHLSNMEQPEEFNKYLQEFLSQWQVSPKAHLTNQH